MMTNPIGRPSILVNRQTANPPLAMPAPTASVSVTESERVITVVLSFPEDKKQGPREYTLRVEVDEDVDRIPDRELWEAFAKCEPYTRKLQWLLTTNKIFSQLRFGEDDDVWREEQVVQTRLCCSKYDGLCVRMQTRHQDEVIDYLTMNRVHPRLFLPEMHSEDGNRIMWFEAHKEANDNTKLMLEYVRQQPVVKRAREESSVDEGEPAAKCAKTQ